MLSEFRALTPALDDVLAQVAEPRERAFITAMCFGVIRTFYRLSAIIDALVAKPIKDSYVQALILVGLFQLRDSGVKDHAAVSETVTAASGQYVWAKPLLNALLRRYQREREAIEAAVDRNETARYWHPPWLIDGLRHDWPDDWASIIAANNRPAELTLRVNQRRIAYSTYLEALESKGIEASPIRPVGAVRLAAGHRIEDLPGYADGWFCVQDVSAQWAAHLLLQFEPAARILDLCAAPGGKTTHLVELADSASELVAVDCAENRIPRLHENLQRLGLQAQVIHGDALTPGTWWDGRPFQRILLDAPCSATGVIRRHPDIKVLRRADDIPTLAQLQRQILQSAWGLLEPDGLLLYCTCSVLKAENEGTIGAFIECVTDAVELPLPADVGRPQRFGRQFLPGDGGGDGFFYCLLQKRA